MAANSRVTVSGEDVPTSVTDDRRRAVSDVPSRTPRPRLAGIGKRNIAYLLFVAVLAVPRDRSGLDPAGRGMAEGFMVILWGLVTLPFGLWNLWDLFGAGGEHRSMRKPAVALLLAVGCLLLGVVFDVF
jgi:hypothetical protein